MHKLPQHGMRPAMVPWSRLPWSAKVGAGRCTGVAYSTGEPCRASVRRGETACRFHGGSGVALLPGRSPERVALAQAAKAAPPELQASDPWRRLAGRAGLAVMRARAALVHAWVAGDPVRWRAALALVEPAAAPSSWQQELDRRRALGAYPPPAGQVRREAKRRLVAERAQAGLPAPGPGDWARAQAEALAGAAERARATRVALEAQGVLAPLERRRPQRAKP